MTTITEISAYILWAMIITAIAYKLKNFDTPFGDSLTDYQRTLMRKSSSKRSKFYSMVFISFLRFSSMSIFVGLRVIVFIFIKMCK